MNLSLLGPPGAGKGTHAPALAARFDLLHVAPGDIFRRNVQQGSPLGLRARHYLEQGELVPDEVVDGMVEDWGAQLLPGQGVIFDGFPRTEDQVRFLDDLFRRLGREIDAVVYLAAADEELARRLAGRLLCRSCQASHHVTCHPPAEAGRCDRCGGELYSPQDDTVELAQARLRVFHRVTGPVLRRFAVAGRLVLVPGDGAIPAVEERLIAAFAAIREGRARFASLAEVEAAAAAPSPRAMPGPFHRGTDLVLLGGPGSGKGTQAGRLAATLQCPHIATGDLFRDHLQRATPLGRLAQTFMERGDLVPDDVTIGMVAERLAADDTERGFILDGFPRTLHQAEALTEMLGPMRRQLAGVLYINVPDDTIVDRLSGRLICGACQAPYHPRFKPPRTPGVCDQCGGALRARTDDDPTTVRARLVTFHRQTAPLVDYYRNAGRLHEIPGAGGVAEITAQALAVIRGLEDRAAAALPAAPAPL